MVVVQAFVAVAEVAVGLEAVAVVAAVSRATDVLYLVVEVVVVSCANSFIHSLVLTSDFKIF